MKILKSFEPLSLSQSHYNLKILENFGYTDYSSVSTPYNWNTYLVKNIDNSKDQDKYS